MADTDSRDATNTSTADGESGGAASRAPNGSLAVGFLGGGQMATALASGAIAAGVLDEAQLSFFVPTQASRERLQGLYPRSTIAASPTELLRDCGRIVLGVKPHVLKQISGDLAPQIQPEHLLVSLAAGIELTALQAMLGTQRVVRVMPNTPCRVGAGASVFAADDSLAADDLQWVRQVMESVGMALQVPDAWVAAVTGVAGSSPAYIYLVIEALSDGGVAMGLPRAIATQLSAQAVMGAAKMVLETGEHPGVLKDQVTSPGGTTIAALRELEAAGTRSAFIEAVCRCTERNAELS